MDSCWNVVNRRLNTQAIDLGRNDSFKQYLIYFILKINYTANRQLLSLMLPRRRPHRNWMTCTKLGTSRGLVCKPANNSHAFCKNRRQVCNSKNTCTQPVICTIILHLHGVLYTRVKMSQGAKRGWHRGHWVNCMCPIFFNVHIKKNRRMQYFTGM